MTKHPPKYNPGFFGDEELIQSFVVRYPDFELILETLRENTGASNQHLLVIGARGSGKTILVRRVAAEVRIDPVLKTQWYPLVFGEESYQVMSPGEFWLEALFHVSDHTQAPKWEQVYAELQREPDEMRLRKRALAQLMDFADEQNKRLLLIVENLNMLLSEQLNEQDDWDLRHTLQNEPRLMLLGTATVHFEEIKNINRAWFEFFAIHELKPLNLKDCRMLWEAVAEEKITDSRLRPMQILTGGNPRLLRILAGFAAKMSLQELLDNLTRLIDDHTEYFKSQLDILAAAERKVFVALLELWNPVGAREVAEIARLDVNRTSSLLSRLVRRGAVEVVDSSKSKKLYQAAERLYNIYYLMRRRGNPANRVRAAVDFIINFYDGEEEELSQEKLSQLEKKYRLSLQHDPKNSSDWVILSAIFALQLNRYEEAEEACLKALKLQPDLAVAWGQLGAVLYYLERYEEAEKAYRKAVDINPHFASAWEGLGELLYIHLERYEEAEKAYRKAVELEPNSAEAWMQLGKLLHEKLEQHEEAKQAYCRSLELKPDSTEAWMWLGKLLHEKLEQHEEAEKAYHRVLELEPNSAEGWLLLGVLLHRNFKRYEEAEQAYRRVLELEPDLALTWGLLYTLLLVSKQAGKAEQVYQNIKELYFKNPLDSKKQLVYLAILITKESWKEAIELIPSLLTLSTEKEMTAPITDFLISTAAAGYAKEVLQVLQTEQVLVMEPLEVGLRIFLGERPLVAKEIFEVGQDVAQRIRDRRQARKPLQEER